MTGRNVGLMENMISRQALCEYALNQKDKSVTPNDIMRFPSAQPTEASCWGCNCQKMERLKEQKTFSEMVHLHDAETHEERTETHACDLISRQAAIECDGFREVERDDERRSN